MGREWTRHAPQNNNELARHTSQENSSKLYSAGKGREGASHTAQGDIKGAQNGGLNEHATTPKDCE